MCWYLVTMRTEVILKVNSAKSSSTHDLLASLIQGPHLFKNYSILTCSVRNIEKHMNEGIKLYLFKITLEVKPVL